MSSEPYQFLYSLHQFFNAVLRSFPLDLVQHLIYFIALCLINVPYVLMFSTAPFLLNPLSNSSTKCVFPPCFSFVLHIWLHFGSYSIPCSTTCRQENDRISGDIHHKNHKQKRSCEIHDCLEEASFDPDICNVRSGERC